MEPCSGGGTIHPQVNKGGVLDAEQCSSMDEQGRAVPDSVREGFTEKVTSERRPELGDEASLRTRFQPEHTADAKARRLGLLDVFGGPGGRLEWSHVLPPSPQVHGLGLEMFLVLCTCLIFNRSQTVTCGEDNKP